MIEFKKLFFGAFLFLIAQSISWYQTNGQFINTWVKEHPIMMSALTGIPVGLGYIYGTFYIVAAFGGKSLWASRLIGFATGVFTFSILTYIHVKEGITLKTGVILALASTIVLLQVFWKTDD